MHAAEVVIKSALTVMLEQGFGGCRVRRVLRSGRRWVGDMKPTYLIQAPRPRLFVAQLALRCCEEKQPRNRG